MKLVTAVGCLLVAVLSASAWAAGPDLAAADREGCLLWLRGDAGVQVGAGGTVAKWLDQSGRGNDLDQVDGVGATVVEGMNHQPALRFDGRGYAYTSHDFGRDTAGQYSVLLVARWTDATPEASQLVLSSHTDNWKFGYQSGDDQSWIGTEWIYQKDWNLYGPGSLNTDWHLHTGTIDLKARPWARFWKDDLLLMDRPRPATNAASWPRQLALAGPARSKCEVAEVLLYDRVLPQATLTRLWQYLSAKYAISSPAQSIAGEPPAHYHVNPDYPIADGPFKPDWRSFRQYECPSWFRDAKFGIWAHWSPQCQPEQGDWYAQHMYEQGSRQYEYHVAHYGHPSQFGYKDICNQWKADKWDPEALITLYQRAGAKYFVALANHHDNFDCWDSTFQPWNSVNVGPKKDIVGTWAQAARKHGLKFGVTVHSARSWPWFEVAHKSDTKGPLTGVAYDGDLTRADGRGKWWDGLDPVDLYGPPLRARTPQAFDAYCHRWFNRTRQLVDKYQPDLLYFDDTQPPLGDAGMSVVAHFLNANLVAHGGHLEAVYNTKLYDMQPPAAVYKSLVDDYEGGHADTLQAYPWQTDTCIGNWHYYAGIKYRSAESVVRELVDVVSKNGNLLLNIPVRGDGSLDADELQFVADLTRWMDVNGQCIFGTRPWKQFTDRPPTENAQPAPPPADLSPDIRFTTHGRTLYATALDWPPDGKLLIRSLPPTAGKIESITLLGSPDRPTWSQAAEGLHLTLPARHDLAYAYVLQIEGEGLTEQPPRR